MILGISPTVDYAFKFVFGQEKNSDILVDLVNAVRWGIASPPLVELDILDPFSFKDSLDDKMSILDVKARDALGRFLNVEMQMLAPAAVSERFVYYWAQIYSNQLQQGNNYSLLRPTISVFILNEVLFEKSPDYHHLFQIANAKRGIVFTDHLELHTIELPEFGLLPDQLVTPLDRWCYFLKNAPSLDTENLPSALKEPNIQRAIEELIVITQDEIERERYLSRLKKQRDDAFFTEAIRDEAATKGKLIGTIQLAQRMLRREVLSDVILQKRSIDDLRQLSEQLENELPK